MDLHTQQGQLTPVAPFDFDKALEFLGYFKPISGEQVVTQRELVKALHQNGQTVVFRLVSTGTPDQPSLEYTLYAAEELNQETTQAMLDRISFFLGLNDDLKPFYALAAEDKAFAPIIDELYGYHQV